MEKLLLEKLHLHLHPPSSSSSSSRLRALSTARSLLTNPNSSDSTRLDVVQTLIQSLDHHKGGDAVFLCHVIKVLGDAAALHRAFAAAVIKAVRPLLDGGDRLAADALAVLASVGDWGVLDEGLVLSLAASSFVAVRLKLIDFLARSVDGAVNSAVLRPRLMVRVLLGLAVDLYPSVRRAAVDGLAVIWRKDGSLVESSIADCCYGCGMMLLKDEDELVRVAAVRLVSACGQVFAAIKEETDDGKQTDVVFLQLCSMARDMSFKVRIEAFNALGKAQLVSENVLLQSLSKKILGGRSGRNPVVECSLKQSNFPVLCAAGAFVHGIEDEFHEVRTVACKTLGMLSVSSIQFAGDALRLLMDMLNDDTASVRLQTLQTLFLMAEYDRLMVQEKHMHMFLCLLADVNAVIRSAARKLLRVMKLPKLKIFKASIDGLITNLEAYPEEEEDIFFVLFLMGKKHGNFAAKVVKEFASEIVPFCEGELSLDRTRTTALLVLAISSPFSDEQLKCDIPAAIFSYAIPLLGRISHSVRDVICQDLLLVHLFQHSRMPFSAIIAKSKEADLLPCEEPMHVSERTTSLEQAQQKQSDLEEQRTLSIKLTLKTVTEAWPLIQSQRTRKAQRMLRICKEELEKLSWYSGESVSALLAFALQYVEVIELVAEIWEQLQLKKFHVSGMAILDLLLEKLDVCLKCLRCRFPGLCREVECHILEFNLLGYMLRLHRLGSRSSIMFKKLHAVVSRLELLCIERSCGISNFAQELKNFLTEGRKGGVSQLFPVHKLLQLFNLEKVPFSEGFSYVKAEMLVIGNNSENPFPFVPGMPIGITFWIALYNISNKEVVWLQMAVGELVQFVFLDICQFEGSHEVRKCTISVPLYASPNAATFLLRACVCMECPLEDVGAHPKKGQDGGGPRHDIVLLCKEIDLYFLQLRRDQ